MGIKYRVVADDERWMLHTAKRLSFETSCDGCGRDLPGYVDVLTDRSGSEYAAVHQDSPECVELAIVWIDEEEE